MKKVLNAFGRVVFSRTLLTLLMIAAQVLVFVFFFVYLRNYNPAVYEIMTVATGLILIVVVNRDEPAEFKLTWAIFICLVPVLGGLFYLFTQSNSGLAGLRKKYNKELDSAKGLISIPIKTHHYLERESRSFYGFAHYMEDICSYPVYDDANAEYFEDGSKAIDDLLDKLREAKDFIFLEYFIIEHGWVWDSILDILKEKASEGVEVRVMYDGLCSLMMLPYSYPKTLEKYGIKAKMFAPIVPFLSSKQNNRDHRKIAVIDGKYAYTGGVNLADEYVNKKVRFGYWKDIAIRIDGLAVDSFSIMFMQMWNMYGKEDLEYEKYINRFIPSVDYDHTGYVIPYGSAPVVEQEVGKTVYEAIFNQSTEYIHIMTPYFIVDREFLRMMRYASERGVDVKIILPHIPDKWLPFCIARSSYPELLSMGVKVYEYTPGFVHAKMMVSDDRRGAMGSVNLDYRSFYHHFECGIFLYEMDALRDMEKDFEETLEKCTLVTQEYYKKLPLIQKVAGKVLKLFGPLM